MPANPKLKQQEQNKKLDAKSQSAPYNHNGYTPRPDFNPQVPSGLSKKAMGFLSLVSFVFLAYVVSQKEIQTEVPTTQAQHEMLNEIKSEVSYEAPQELREARPVVTIPVEAATEVQSEAKADIPAQIQAAPAPAPVPARIPAALPPPVQKEYSFGRANAENMQAIEGVWEGEYDVGPEYGVCVLDSSIEKVKIEISESGFLTATKITGDCAVGAGEVSWFMSPQSLKDGTFNARFKRGVPNGGPERFISNADLTIIDKDNISLSDIYRSYKFRRVKP